MQKNLCDILCKDIIFNTHSHDIRDQVFYRFTQTSTDR